MSHDDDHRSRDRGAYTPPTDDDLPFRRSGGFDARGGSGGGKPPPVTLIVSAVVLLALIVAVALFYRSGLRASTDAPPAVGVPVNGLKVEAPADAQPVDPEAGVRVYRDTTEPTDAEPVFTPGPEAPQPRPAEIPPAPTAGGALAPAVPAATPAPAPAPAPAVTAPTPAPAAAGGSSAVQIGAFSSREIADREYAAVAARFPQFASGAQKGIQQVTASNGATVYRTTFTGFNRERATAFCQALRSAGRDCLVR